jgi:hypothetical protein
MGWSKTLVGTVEVQTIPGYHDSILFGPRLERLVTKLRQVLDGVD